MAGLDDVTTNVDPTDTGLPPSTAAAPAKKKATVPNQAGLNEMVANPEYAKERDAKVRDYYQKQLDAIESKQQSIGERWGLNDLYAQFGGATGATRAQMMGLRQKELEAQKAGKKEATEGIQTLDQMKQAVQTRQAFNEYLQGADYYAQLAGQTKDEKQKALFERNAMNLTKQAQYLDPQAFAGYQQQRQDSIMKIGADTTALDFSGGTPKVIAQTGPKTSDLIADKNLQYTTGQSVLGNRGGATLGGNVPAGGPAPAQASGAPAGGSTTAPAGGQQPSTPKDANKPAVTDARTAHYGILDSYQPNPTPIIKSLPPAEQTKLTVEKPKEFQKANTVVQNFSNLDKIVGDILSEPTALATATGQTGFITKYTNSKARDASLQLDRLREMSSIEGLKKLRASGTAPGSITEAEWPRFESYFANLKNAQSPEQMQKALKELRSALATEAVEARRLYEDTYGADKRFDAGFQRFKSNPKGAEEKGKPTTPIATVNNDADYDKLPSGAKYRGPDGIVRTK